MELTKITKRNDLVRKILSIFGIALFTLLMRVRHHRWVIPKNKIETGVNKTSRKCHHTARKNNRADTIDIQS